MDFLFNEITEFLNGNRTYQQGVDLYKDYGLNSALKTLFTLGEDNYSRTKLKAELRQMLASLGDKKPVYETYSQPKKKGSIDVEALPPHLKVEYFKIAPAIREIAATNPTLIHLKTDQDRFVSAKRIVDLSKKRRSIFDRLDHFQEHGSDHPFYIPVPVIEIQKETNEMGYYEAQHKLKLARSQKSKLRNNAARHADYKKYCDQIEELEAIVAKGPNK